MKTLILLAASLAAPALAAASPASPAMGEPASIPFANHPRAIRDFEAPSDEIVYLQDRQRRWYRADLGHCFGLKWAQAIGYDTRGGLSLDSFGAILVEGRRCPILSLTRSDGPPRKAKKGSRHSRESRNP
ncbi:MAG TPA: DUF6491 family protein [Allosphingosinicella sp.]|nr:DUF6491 family protein [Allosphingosinicella sp.]